MKQQVINYWQSLKEQEQKLLIVAGVVFVIFVLVMGVIKPLNEGVEDAQKDLQKQKQLHAWVSKSVAQLKASGGSKAVSGNRNLTQLVNRTRGRHGIQISKMQPRDNTLRINIDNVEFNKLVSWIDELTNQHGVKIANLDLGEEQQQGYVRVSRLVLEI
ncbi:general secretion pathway protein GspM [Pseudoalteromonas luteoviolacea]|uniref:Type II secretion system protein M n=1 Tax=Pseudoalteromonas luteoviolacea TaxID=43657 RepID=A0A1C0TL61_9GAMM|nr:type II secretion system protein M [Pseudoalteromonas luteoviolacea]MBQ4813811.1 type II secretion system protein M [Pseudoalteromonas luteoviolacea]OCQ19593.1 general secretion pathway protein GspM [Pseudoalteromonas luteoviolacea]